MKCVKHRMTKTVPKKKKPLEKMLSITLTRRQIVSACHFDVTFHVMNE